ncbi:MAG: adenosine kinase [Spirochaetales bacterium]
MVYGIGNPLIDVMIKIEDEDLTKLGIEKGIMHLVSEEQQKEILETLIGRPIQFRPGGSAPNTLLALAGLGIPAVISGKIGTDEFGQTYDEQVAAYGITSRLVMEAGVTESSVILITPDGERTMNTHLGMCQKFTVDDVDEELLRQADYLYFTGYMWDTEVQKESITTSITICKETGAKIVFDVADPFAVGRYRDDFLELLERDIDIAFANTKEAAILFDTPEARSSEARVKAIEQMGELVDVAILKVGKDGSLVRSQGRTSHIPGEPIDVVDTTGAGDMFAAGFLAGIALGKELPVCAKLAGDLAEAVITQTGAQFSLERIEELKRTLLV